MIASILSLALAYVFLLSLLVLAVFKSELHAGSKLALVALCIGFYLWHYGAMKAYLGWPAGDELPARFELISRITIEPDLQNDDAGSIYLWLRDLDHDDVVPRAYRLPYIKELHRKVDDTLRRQSEGERFVGSPSSASGRGGKGIEFESVQRDSQSHKSISVQ